MFDLDALITGAAVPRYAEPNPLADDWNDVLPPLQHGWDNPPLEWQYPGDVDWSNAPLSDGNATPLVCERGTGGKPSAEAPGSGVVEASVDAFVWRR